jgi:hypothetical protein
MSLATQERALIDDVQITDEDLVVSLMDGRTVSVPLVWFPRLVAATAHQRENYELLGDGEGIHWPDIDDDISVEGLLRGTHARPRSPHGAERNAGTCTNLFCL